MNQRAKRSLKRRLTLTALALKLSNVCCHQELSIPRHRKTIVNGSTATKHRYEYASSIRYGSHHMCGGSLVAPDIILSAAHCYNHPGQNLDINLEVVVGEYHLQDRHDGGETFVVDRVEVHPEYHTTSTYLENDVLVMKISGKSRKSHVKLNSRNRLPSNRGRGAPLTVMGWGSLDTNGFTMATILQEVNLRYIENEECIQRGINGVTDQMMCAFDLDEDGLNEDSCYGDSGGPLVRKRHPDYGDLQVGIVSFGAQECGVFPGVYTRISSVYGWIRRRVCELSDDPPDDFNCDKLAGRAGGSSIEHQSSSAGTNHKTTSELIQTIEPSKIPTTSPSSLPSTIGPSASPTIEHSTIPTEDFSTNPTGKTSPAPSDTNHSKNQKTEPPALSSLTKPTAVPSDMPSANPTIEATTEATDNFSTQDTDPNPHPSPMPTQSMSRKGKEADLSEGMPYDEADNNNTDYYQYQAMRAGDSSGSSKPMVKIFVYGIIALVTRILLE